MTTIDRTADAVLALPAVRELLDAARRVEAVKALAAEFSGSSAWASGGVARRIRRALDSPL